MPFDDPATLTDDVYLDSVAYVLQYNGFPAGEADLDPERLAGIRIQGRDGPGPVPSFALVQVVGCLTAAAAAGGDWMLTGSTEAVRTRDPAASDAEALAALAEGASGTATFSLMSVYPDPAEHAGHRMEVKGFLIRRPDGDRINRQLPGDGRPRLRPGRIAGRARCPTGDAAATARPVSRRRRCSRRVRAPRCRRPAPA